MQRLIYTIIVSFFLLLSCNKSKPSGILSEDKMTDLMTEVSLIDAYLNTLPMDSGKKVLPVLYDKTFKQFGIDSAQFVKNIDFYMGNPVLTEKVYKNVGDKLLVYDKEYAAIDSIRNVFVQDSITRENRKREDIDFIRNLVMNFHKDSTNYTYQQRAQLFHHTFRLNVGAYGVQVPLQPTPVVPPNTTTAPVPNTPAPTEQLKPEEPVAQPIDAQTPAPVVESNELSKPVTRKVN